MKKFFPVDSDCVLCLTDRKKSSTVWTDLSKAGNDGTIYGAATPPAATAGRLGYTFDGVDDYINCGNGSNLKTLTDMSISMYVKLNDITDGIIFVSHGMWATTGWYIQYRIPDNTLRYLEAAISPTSVTQKSVDLGFVTGVWYHVVFTKNGIYGNWYINAINKTDTHVNLVPTLITTDKNLIVGAYFDYTTPVSGIFSDIRIYNRALSASEILNYYGKTRKFYGV